MSWNSPTTFPPTLTEVLGVTLTLESLAETLANKAADPRKATIYAALIVAEAIRVSVGQLTQVISQKGPIER
jgi:hypothetical protein